MSVASYLMNAIVTVNANVTVNEAAQSVKIVLCVNKYSLY